MVEIKLNGTAELAAALRAFPLKLNERIQGSALLAGAQPVRDRARDLAPVLAQATARRLPGTLKKNIRMARSRPRPGMTATVVIGVRRISKSQIRKINRVLRASKQVTGQSRTLALRDIVGDPFFWHFMEFGYTDRAGKWHGPHGGKGYLRAAFDEKKTLAIENITAATKIRVEIATRQLGLKVAA